MVLASEGFNSKQSDNSHPNHTLPTTSTDNDEGINQSTNTFETINQVEQATDMKNMKQTKWDRLHELIKKSLLPVFWILFTGFFIAAYVLQVPKGYNQELLILALIYLYTTLFLLFCHVPTTIITRPWKCMIHSLSQFLYSRFSHRVLSVAWAAFVITVILATVFSFPEKPESPRERRLIAVFGFFVFIFVLYSTSTHRKEIRWNTICTAFFIQFILALFVFRTSVGNDIFQWIATFVESFLGYSWFGTSFIFGTSIANSGIFAVNIFPPAIFFAAVVQVLYYLGTIQFILKKISVPFLGASENALLIAPLIKDLTRSELHMILTCGFATISGSMLYGYVAMGISGKALLTSCIMSIPCSIAVSKLRYPDIEQSAIRHITIIPITSNDATNVLHAAGKGAKLGIELVLLIMANVIVLLSSLNAFNGLLTWVGHFVNIENLTLQLVTGYVFIPVAWLIGADNKDLVIVGRLMATKIWANEYVAFQDMTNTYKELLSSRSELVATYALCGFANFGTLGSQVAVLSSLAPTRVDDISSLSISALICGTLSTWLSASVAGMLI
ncbi:hypothetical protein G6F39_008709 [Rhizopus arrhizus]|nr:hypothetical protein G6F39_008709 [Rhizopus arrhizus]